MAHLIPFGDEPEVSREAFVAPTAVLIGDVVVEEGASIWFGAVLRGDFDRIVVGAGSSVQDNCVLHTNEGLLTIVGRNVTVGHLSLLRCEIGEGPSSGWGVSFSTGPVLVPGQCSPPGALLRRMRRYRRKSWLQERPPRSRRAWTEAPQNGSRGRARVPGAPAAVRRAGS